VLGLSLGKSKNKLVRLYVFVSRTALVLFFIQLQMVTLVELGYHAVRDKDPYKFKYSYTLSTIFTNILAIELMRAYVLIKKKKTLQEIAESDFNYEQRLLH
jgi:hypothetical protein